MSNYAQELMDNEAIETSSSSLPDFPGRMLAYNNNTGDLGIFVPGEFENAEQIESLKFAMAFVMKRLKFRDANDETTTSTYVVGGSNAPFHITVNGQTYTGSSKKDIVSEMGLQDPSMIKQEVIYIGFAIQINGKNLDAAEPIWYVSRGVNDWRLNDEIKATVNKLNKRTMIKLLADKEKYKNASGGTNIVMNFEVDEVQPEQIQGFADYITKHGADLALDVYKQEMLQVTSEAPTPVAQQTAPNNGIPDDPWSGGQEIEISDDDLPF